MVRSSTPYVVTCEDADGGEIMALGPYDDKSQAHAAMMMCRKRCPNDHYVVSVERGPYVRVPSRTWADRLRRIFQKRLTRREQVR